MRWSSLRRLVRAIREGAANGDIALLKSDAFEASASPDCEARIAHLSGYHPPIDLEALRALPDATLGREYARLLDANGFTPFAVTEAIEPEIIARNVFGLRYAVTHDMFHVVTGFDTSWAGEIGVLGFAAAQRYLRAQLYSIPLALVIYILRAPRQARAIVRCLREGWRMGRAAEHLLAQRLEDDFATPVMALRARLHIDDAPGPGAAPAPGRLAMPTRPPSAATPAVAPSIVGSLAG